MSNRKRPARTSDAVTGPGRRDRSARARTKRRGANSSLTASGAAHAGAFFGMLDNALAHLAFKPDNDSSLLDELMKDAERGQAGGPPALEYVELITSILLLAEFRGWPAQEMANDAALMVRHLCDEVESSNLIEHVTSEHVVTTDDSTPGETAMPGQA